MNNWYSQSLSSCLPLSTNVVSMHRTGRGHIISDNAHHSLLFTRSTIGISLLFLSTSHPIWIVISMSRFPKTNPSGYGRTHTDHVFIPSHSLSNKPHTGTLLGSGRLGASWQEQEATGYRSGRSSVPRCYIFGQHQIRRQHTYRDINCRVLIAFAVIALSRGVGYGKKKGHALFTRKRTHQ